MANSKLKIDRYVVITIAAVLIAGFLFAVKYYRQEQRNSQEKVMSQFDASQPPSMMMDGSLTRDYSPTHGPADAKVTVVEFMDPQCATCRQYYPVVKSIMDEFKGQVRVVVRFLPFHNASIQAMSALHACLDQNRFWEGLEVLFTHQPEWGDPVDTHPELIAKFLSPLGIAAGVINEAMKNPTYQERIAQDQRDAVALGIRQTPTFFVNGTQVHDLSEEAVKAAIKQALAPQA